MSVNWHCVSALITVALVLTSDVRGEGAHWTYYGVEQWAEQYNQCEGKKQSPINFDSATVMATNFQPLYMGNYDTAEKAMTLTNNGHTVLLSWPKNHAEYGVPYVKDGGLSSVFNLAQLHFHWGSDSTQGSEHTLQSKRFPAEIHFVHYNTKYGTFANSTAHPDGLAVVGVFVKAGEYVNKAFQPIADAMDDVIEEGSDSPLKMALSLKDLLPVSRSKFYRYSGSLTTPGCQEIVTWTVFDTPISVSENQLSKFRRLKTDGGLPLVNNYRPVQKLQGRSVHVRSSASPTAVMSLAYILIPSVALLSWAY